MKHPEIPDNGWLIKILSGHDRGGVKTAEMSFLQEFSKRRIHILGLIIGDGPSSDDYRSLLDDYVSVKYDLPNFGGVTFYRAWSVIKNELLSRYISRNILDGLSNREAACPKIQAVCVRRAQYLCLAGLLAQRMKCICVWHMPDAVTGPTGRIYYRSLLRRFDIRPIGNSYYTLRSLVETGDDVVYPGFYRERVQTRTSHDLREYLMIPVNTVVFGFAARLTKVKGPDLIMNAFIKSEPFKEGAHLVIAGGPLDTSLGRHLTTIAKTRGKGQIHILGEIQNIADFYRMIDVFINGRRNPEPFGIAIVEAMAAGKPAIAYRVGGPSETISDGETGWLVQNPTESAYASAINTAWSQRCKWPQMQTACMKSVDNYEVGIQVEKYLKFIGLK